jgi:hypothetical protein
MEMEAVNAKGEGGFSEGMMPQCAALDDLSRPLGDASEGMLAIAMRRIQGQSCGQAAGHVFKSEGLAGMSLRDQSELIRPEWQTNKWLPTKP